MPEKDSPQQNKQPQADDQKPQDQEAPESADKSIGQEKDNNPQADDQKPQDQEAPESADNTGPKEQEDEPQPAVPDSTETQNPETNQAADDQKKQNEEQGQPDDNQPQEEETPESAEEDEQGTTQREEQYGRQLGQVRESARGKAKNKNPDSAQSPKQSLFQRMGRGRFGRFGRAGMAAGMAANNKPNLPQQSPDTKPDQQGNNSYYQDGSSKGSGDVDENGRIKKAKAAEGIATAGQVAGRTTQVAAKGAELAARGTEAMSSGISKGGQAITRAGAELSGTGLGAIAGVPMMIAGGALTATGEAGKAASKGAQKASQSAGQFGQRVAESSKKAKEGIKQAREIGLGENKDSSGMPYMDLARKLREEKRKLMQGDVKGIVSDAANTAGQMATARALSWAWLALIPTFGLSLIYINIHFIARYIVGSEKFCKFGEEWALKKMASEGGEGNPVEEMSQMLGKVEILGMFVLDALVIALILLINILMDLSACLANNPVNTVFDPDSCYTSTKQ